MKIAIFGGMGQLGKELKNSLEETKLQYMVLDRLGQDVTDYSKLKNFFNTHGKELTHIINAAAYTKVDECERSKEESKKANEVNNKSVFNICSLAAKNNIKVCHISTDFVFNGLKPEPYSEEDTPGPLSTYGKTKLMGEFHVTRYSKENLLIRTSWTYSALSDNNFVKNILEKAKNNQEIKGTIDQVGSPTNCYDLSKAIIQLVKSDKNGLYHIANVGQVSRYEYIIEILKAAGYKAEVKKIRSSELMLPARRFQQSALDCSKYQKEIDELRGWKEALHECIKNMNSSE